MAESAERNQKNWFWCPSLAMVTSIWEDYSENLQKSYKQQLLITLMVALNAIIFCYLYM